MKMHELTGVIAAAATPLNDDRSINSARLAEHCRWLLSWGCDGINLLGTTGEATSFSADQRVAAMRAVAEAGLPLDRFMVGTGAAALADSIRLTREATALGFGGALLLPPFYYKGISDDALIDFIETVLSAVGDKDLSLYLYNIPQNTGVAYSPEMIARLLDRIGGALKGLKDSAGSLDYARTLAAAHPELSIFPSTENLLAEADHHGFAGCISASANITAPLAAQAWRQRGTAAGAEAGACAAAIRKTLIDNDLIPSVKWALADLTGSDDWLRLCPPLRTHAADSSDKLRAELAETAYRELHAIAARLAVPA